MAAPRCIAITKSGKQCTWTPWQGHPWCLSHSAVNGIEEASATMLARSKMGSVKAELRRESARLKTCDLRSTSGQLDQLEGALVRVANSDGDACSKASAICKLVSEARAVMKDAVLEKENGELRALIERHPEVRKRLSLKAVT